MIFALMTFLALMGPSVSSEQTRAAQSTKQAVSKSLTQIRQAVEDHFKKLEEGTTVRLRDVSITPSKGGATLTVEIAPPSDQKFEFHAETSYIHIWQVLVKERSGFREVSTVRLSLVRPARRMTIQCPIKSVEDSYGYTDFARLKRLCEIR